MLNATELEARAAGEIVYRSHSGQVWCLCTRCTAHHARSPRRTKHDRWALSGQDWRIYDALSSREGTRR